MIVPQEFCDWFLALQESYDDTDFLRAFFPTLMRYTNVRELAGARMEHRRRARFSLEAA
jgi:hypothetical protein